MTDINKNLNRLDQLKQLLIADPSDSFLLFAIAKEYEKQENWEMTIQWLEQLRKQDPNYGGLYFHLASAYDEVEDKSAALTICQIGVDVLTEQKDEHSLKELKNLQLNLSFD